MTNSGFSWDLLNIDPAAESARLEAAIRETVFRRLRRKGAVVAISGGVDSSVAAALCARALGAQRVLGLLLPEADTSSDSTPLAYLLAGALGLRTELENITGLLEAAGCYHRRDEAVRSIFPSYGPGWKCKIALPSLDRQAAYPIFSVVVQPPGGAEQRARLSHEAYLAIVAATNFKQRTRKMLEYYYADRLQYAVVGTPNRLEFDQGFFVKNGDGAADLKPIAHLYKCQVYQLARFLEIPHEIVERQPTTDTYSLEQSQEEFYFTLPLAAMDACLFARDHDIPPAALAPHIGLEPELVQRAFDMIDSKRRAAAYLHEPPVLLGSR